MYQAITFYHFFITGSWIIRRPTGAAKYANLLSVKVNLNTRHMLFHGSSYFLSSTHQSIFYANLTINEKNKIKLIYENCLSSRISRNYSTENLEKFPRFALNHPVKQLENFGQLDKFSPPIKHCNNTVDFIKRNKNGGKNVTLNPKRVLHNLVVLLDSALPSSEPVNVPQIWQFVRKNLYPGCSALTNPSLIDIPHIKSGKVFSKLVNLCATTWCDRYTLSDNQPIPSPSCVIEFLRTLGHMQDDAYSMALWIVVQRIWFLNENSIRLSHVLVQELLKLWRISLSNYEHTLTNQSRRTSSGSLDWSCLPGPMTLEALLLKRILVDGTVMYDRTLAQQIEAVTTNLYRPLSESIAAALIASLDILMLHISDSQLKLTVWHEKENFPFLQFASHLIQSADVSQAVRFVEREISRTFLSPNSSVTSKQLKFWLGRIAHVSERCRAIHEFNGELSSISSSNVLAQVQVHDEKQIERYFTKRLHEVDSLGCERMGRTVYESILKVYTIRNRHGERIQIPVALCQTLLSMLIRFGLETQTTTLCNAIMASGSYSMLEIWRMLIIGFRKAAKPDAIYQTWQQMIELNIKPDANVYTEAIYGYLKCSWYHEGIHLLKTMTENWLKAVNEKYGTNNTAKGTMHNNLLNVGDLPGAPKPRSGTLNTVLTCLANSSGGPKDNMIDTVMKWAESLAIEPEIVTYNVLLNMYIKEGNIEKAMDILKTMNDHHVQPNVITFTIISNLILGCEWKPSEKNFGTYENCDMNQYAQSQRDKVIKFLREIDKRGISPNRRMLTSIIGNLIKNYENIEAVNAILEFMKERSIRPCIRIYTMLLEYYSHQNESTITDQCIEELWNKILSDNVRVDAKFYDSMIKRYSQTGKVGKMMTLLSKMSKQGITPSWLSLLNILSTLIYQANFARARELVDQVVQLHPIPTSSHTCNRSSWTDEQNFWILAHRNGLFESRNCSDPNPEFPHNLPANPVSEFRFRQSRIPGRSPLSHKS